MPEEKMGISATTRVLGTGNCSCIIDDEDNYDNDKDLSQIFGNIFNNMNSCNRK
jgi:hypothetical protein